MGSNGSTNDSFDLAALLPPPRMTIDVDAANAEPSPTNESQKTPKIANGVDNSDSEDSEMHNTTPSISNKKSPKKKKKKKSRNSSTPQNVHVVKFQDGDTMERWVISDEGGESL